MPSSYTQSGVELIGNGEQSGTWGTTTNTNLQIIDRMVSQAGAITLSGTTHTLTISDGVLSDGQYGILVFGGSPSGTNTVTISPNDAQRTYIVKNDSGESVVLTQGSGGNVTVADGRGAIVYCDGAGSGAAVVDLTATFVSTLATLGVTASAAELNILDGVTASTAELNILDGVTASTAELNILDGVTASTAELNILDGVTATFSEINLLDGVTWTLTDYNSLTASAEDLNQLDGVTGTLVTEAGTQTLTNKTLTSPTMTAPTITDGLTIDTETANWTGAVTLDPANGLYQEITLTGNVTGVTDSLEDGESVILAIDDGTAYEIIWPTITWISDKGVAPALQTTGVTIITVWKAGTTLYGFASNGA